VIKLECKLHALKIFHLKEGLMFNIMLAILQSTLTGTKVLNPSNG
jgi:hypothetical protein